MEDFAAAACRFLKMEDEGDVRAVLDFAALVGDDGASSWAIDFFCGGLFNDGNNLSFCFCT